MAIAPLIFVIETSLMGIHTGRNRDWEQMDYETV